MDTTASFIDRLRAGRKHEELEQARDAFQKMDPAARLPMQGPLIDMLCDKTLNPVVRAWIPSFLGLIGTPTARQALLDQMKEETDGYVRGWIARNLIDNFEGDDRIPPVLDLVRNEKISENRVYLASALIRKKVQLAIPLLEELLVDEEQRVREVAAYGLGQLQAQDAVPLLSERLKKEEALYVRLSVIEALQKIGSPAAVPALLELIQTSKENQARIAALDAVGTLGSAADAALLTTVIAAAADPARVVAISAVDTLVKLVSPDEAARRIADVGLQQGDKDLLARFGDALRFVGSTGVVEYLSSVHGDPDRESRAQVLLEQVGGAQAVNVLVNRRIETLRQAEKRVEMYDREGVSIFKSTIENAQQGFRISLIMSVTIFVIGVALLAASIIMMVQAQELLKLLFAAGTGLAGLGTVLTMFYRGPLERVERAVANLVQTEIAFLGYIRQVTQISAMFEREYLDGQDFGLKQLRDLLTFTEHAMKESMPLVNQYTAVPFIDRETVDKTEPPKPPEG